jgi:hypothetical protein
MLRGVSLAARGAFSPAKHHGARWGPPFAIERWGPAWTHALHTPSYASDYLYAAPFTRRALAVCNYSIICSVLNGARMQHLDINDVFRDSALNHRECTSVAEKAFDAVSKTSRLSGHFKIKACVRPPAKGSAVWIRKIRLGQGWATGLAPRTILRDVTWKYTGM